MNDRRTAAILFEAEQGRVPSFTWRDLVRIFFKYKAVILNCALVVPFAVSLGLYCLPASFVTSAKVLVRIEEQGTPTFFSGIAAFRDSTTPEPANRKFENEMEFVDVWPNAAEVVRRMGLTYDRVYHSPLAHLVDPVTDFYEHVMARYFDVPPKPDRKGFVDTVNALQQSISVAPLVSKSAETTSNLMEVRLRGVDAASTQKTLEQLLDVYQNFDTAQKRESSQRAYDIIAAETGRAKEAVLAAQNEIERFMAQRRVVRGSTATANATSAGDPPQALSGPRDESTIGSIRARLLRREIELSDMQRDFPGRVGEIQSLQQSIADLESRLDQEVKKYAENEARLLELQRALHLAEMEYTELDKRLAQISLFQQVMASALPSRTIVEPPLVPASSEWKKKILVAVLSVFSGLALGICLAAVRQFGDHRLETEADVERHLGIPVVASFPRVSQPQLEEGASISSPSELAVESRHAHA
jgi:uncharacterized protein involved in exopolysaccharide biosynthesis